MEHESGLHHLLAGFFLTVSFARCSTRQIISSLCLCFLDHWNGDNSSTHIIGLWWGLNELIYVMWHKVMPEKYTELREGKQEAMKRKHFTERRLYAKHAVYIISLNPENIPAGKVITATSRLRLRSLFSEVKWRAPFPARKWQNQDVNPSFQNLGSRSFCKI